MKNKRNISITIADVAREAGVSAMTVSRALREPERVSVKSLSRIRAVIARLGYLPDPAAQALAAGRTNVIGVIVPSVTNNVFADVMRGVYAAAEDSRWQVQLGNSRYSPLEEERLVKTFLSQRPAGLIISGIDQSDETRALLRTSPCRIVQIMEISDQPLDMMIGFSHLEAARAATRHLLAMGYTRPGFLGARLDPRTQRRLAGFRDVAAAAGLLEDRRIVTTPQASTVTLGGLLMADLLSRAPETDAILCNNDDLALGALFECQRRGIAVPGKIGICGFNDLEMMAAAHPAISSVRTHRYEMGERAMRMLAAALDASEPAEPVVDLGFEVVERQSTLRP
ncbi:LacI family DNA-binding transcriptional regulator [Hoeflea sp. YIM 152468]|uniref:LacI family DNA-binding transcriptional regulator n=1 Tax=Hoeflea sp. YIM 152468 TaxID=3031759 RepID=UPI0023DA76D2|nr:LacI family DNA-binding transcriptional regulator [Hoeflea sp. YIM 152468]MDF1608352.1 LacI family DNA-binding transcriptional regulator [Hoeflea sp. YIM 152468]